MCKKWAEVFIHVSRDHLFLKACLGSVQKCAHWLSSTLHAIITFLQIPWNTCIIKLRLPFRQSLKMSFCKGLAARKKKSLRNTAAHKISLEIKTNICRRRHFCWQTELPRRPHFLGQHSGNAGDACNRIRGSELRALIGSLRALRGQWGSEIEGNRPRS